MACYDCERDPCICSSLFPFARIRRPEGIYDHNGDLLVSVEDMHAAKDPPRREFDACPWCDGTGGEAMAPCRRCNGDGLIPSHG